MRLVVTTGTFGFNELVDKIVESLGAISTKYTEVIIQYGRTEPNSLKRKSTTNSQNFSLIKVAYYTAFDDFIQGADLVVSHAGTGTVLSLLKHNAPFIIVPNKTLLHNHQEEYTNSLQETLTVSSLSSLVDDIMAAKHTQRTLTVSSTLWSTHFMPLLK
ncbi:beta-1,4-N-acetylglucosaminyltransferase [Nematocida minor]|uniref:beta-1,4-N-acetylglucosaminyltransferase n=1 Tax=Nematocida minor TaxID=1912983 RepID=UPI00221F7420|nr:beta-1,4-N-acetylglucosaminyltransferase [Nematocida minor]KAI5190409.1 beta-1,4-N-acetylglucosaminyltransferase [Nematocida minor]